MYHAAAVSGPHIYCLIAQRVAFFYSMRTGSRTPDLQGAPLPPYHCATHTFSTWSISCLLHLLNTLCYILMVNSLESLLVFGPYLIFITLIVAFMESESSHQYCWCRNALLTYSGNFAYWISQSSPSYCSFGASKLFKVYSLLTLYFIVVYDVTKRESFSNLADVWTQEIEANSTNKDCIKMLVGNKVDKVPSLLENWLLFAFLEKLWSDL